MARKVWKLGKFDKGINSYTDPKDIKDNEWAELEDVDVSKVGVAKTIGIPTKDTSVHQTIVEELIGGKGLYKFDSDNSYNPSSHSSSFHLLSNTEDGGGGTKSRAEFNIKSLVWLFSTKPNYGTIKFQLYIGATAITDEFTVVYCDNDSSTRKFMHTTGDTERYNTNIFDGASDFEDFTSVNYLWSNEGPLYSTLVGKILWHPPGGNTIAESPTWDGGKGDWYTNNQSAYDNQFIPDYDVIGKVGPASPVFWYTNGIYEGSLNDINDNDGDLSHNLNVRSLLFDATYASNGYPSDNVSGDYFMMGFYDWAGYIGGLEAHDGASNSVNWTDGEPQAFYESSFTVPHKYNSDLTDSSSEDWIKEEYYKTKLSFMSQLIQQINSYSGSLQFSAQFADWESDNAVEYTTDFVEDMIEIEAKANGDTSGAITGKFTYTAGGGGGVLYTGNVTLLADVNRYGQAYEGTDGGIPTTNDFELENQSVRNGTGGAMVISGMTSVIPGDAENVFETWKLTIKGNPLSQEKINVRLISEGGSILSKEFTLTANYLTNEEYANAIRTIINSTYTGSSGYNVTDVAVVDSDSSGDTFPGYSILIKSNTAGIAYQFGVEVLWENAESSTGVSDEQLALVSKSAITFADGIGGQFLAKVSNFKLWSSFSNTWVSKFSNTNNSSVDTNNHHKYLNWYYTATENNDPLFYDEGNDLRIVETNFDLLQDLDIMIPDGAITSLEDAGYLAKHNNPRTGVMWSNPPQWVGYRDISTHFGNAWNYSTDKKAFFIGIIPRIWNYTATADGVGNAQILNGVSQNLDTNIKTATGADNPNIDMTYGGLRIYMVKNSSGGSDWTGSIKVYAVACYDDGSETLPSHHFTTSAVSGAGYFDDSDTNKLQMNILFRPENSTGEKLFSDVRINGVRLYYTHSDENHSTFWDLGKIDFNRGFVKASTIDITDNQELGSGLDSKYKWDKVSNSDFTSAEDTGSELNLTLIKQNSYDADNINGVTTIEYTEMPKSQSYEDINGFSPENSTITVEYKAVCIAGRRTFAGNIRVWDGSGYRYYNDRMVVSPVNALDTFPYPSNILDLEISDGDEIIALSAYGDKVIQFKKKTVYILNISTGIASEFFIEERHKWKGIINKNHFCNTDEGIFWVNSRGAWIYDGEEIKDLFILGDDDESQQVLDKDIWSSFVSEDSLVGYDAPTRNIIILKNHTYTSSGDSDCFIYSLVVNSWTKAIKRFWTSDNKSITNFQSISSTGKLSFLSEEVPNSLHGEIG